MESLQTIQSDEMVEIQSQAITLNRTGNSIKILSKEEIFKLIDVHEPYYALKDVIVYAGNFATASIEVEQPLGDEIFPIGAAEACRHLAILGSVCCALSNPVKQKHYYLAHRGTYKRAIEKTHYTGKKLVATATCTFFSKRMANIKACLLDEDNQLICGIENSFHVVPHAIFERLYYNFHKEIPDFGLKNPYRQKKQLFDVQFSALSASASLGKIQDDYCAGHFPHFPAMPVAILMNTLLDLAAAYIHHITGDKSLKMYVREMTLLADNLGFSGEIVVLHVKQEAYTNNRFKLRCTATSTDNKSVGDVNVIIETAAFTDLTLE